MDVSKTSARSRLLSVNKKMMKRALLLAGLIVAALVWLALRHEPARLNDTRQAIVMRGDLQPIVEVLGTIRPLGLQIVPAQTAGRIVRIDVEPGQSVKKGAILLVMANDAAQSELATARMKYAEASSRVEIAKAQAESDVESSRAQLVKARTAEAYARSQYKATATVSKLGAVSRMQLEEMKAKLDMAVADTAAADTSLSSSHKVGAAKMRGQIEESNVLKQELERRRQQVDELIVRAPMDGFIADRTAEIGTNVTTGTPLLTFVDNSGYYVQLNIPEEASQKVRVGDKVSIAIGNRKLDGRISRIAPLSKKGYVTADAVFANREANLPSIDSTVQVQIRCSKLRNVLYVKAPVYIRGSQAASIDVVRRGSNLATRREVVFGARVGEFVTVLKGLAQGDRILIGDDNANEPAKARF